MKKSNLCKIIVLASILQASSSHAALGKLFGIGNSNDAPACSKILTVNEAPSIGGLLGMASNAASTAASQAAGKLTELEQLQTDIKAAVDEATASIENITFEGSEEDHKKLLAAAVISRVPGAAWRVIDFELTPSKFLEEIVVPVYAFIAEYEANTLNQSLDRRAKVEATLAVRVVETGFKGIKAGVFGILPNPFALLYDLNSVENDIKNSAKSDEKLMNEMLSILYSHMQKEIVDPDPNKGLTERMATIAELKPVLEQFSEMLARRIQETQENFGGGDIATWLNNKTDEFRFEHFGDLDNTADTEAGLTSIMNYFK